MPVTARLRYLRIAPRKVRLVADLIRGKSVEEAQTVLSFTTKKAAQTLLKLLNSAIANAKNLELDPANLYIAKILVDEGPKYKRWIARARGRADEIQKKTSHITLVLDEIKKKPKKVKKLRPSRRPPRGPLVKPKVIEKEKAEERVIKPEKPKFRPEVEVPKPKIERGIRRIFRRKAF